MVNNTSHLMEHSSSPLCMEREAAGVSLSAEECRSCFQTGQVSEGGNVSKHASSGEPHLFYK